MKISGTSSSSSAAAGTSGSPGPAGGPTAALSPPRGLSPRRAAQADKARQIFEANTAFIAHRATREQQNAAPAARPVIEWTARWQIEQMQEDLDRTLHRIQNPPLWPASNEPAQRVVGFDIKPPAP